MGRTDRSKGGTRKNPNEGTSARTRSFSFDDIMSRRKKKQNTYTNDKDSKMESLEGATNTIEHPSPNYYQITMASKETVKESSRKEETIFRRDDDLIKRRDTDGHDLEVGPKLKSIQRKSNRDRENTDEKYSHHLSKTGNFNATVFEKPSGRKRLKDFDVKDEFNEHYRKSKRDDEYDEHHRKSKRDKKGDSHNDDKCKVENAKKSKKHDSKKLQDTKYSERNGHKNHHIESFYEDPRKRRRSRSLQYDPEREMSNSLSPLSRKNAYHMQQYRDSYKGDSRKKHSDADRYRTPGDGDRYKILEVADRYKTYGDGDRYKISGDGDRYKASGDGDKYKASGDGGYSSGHHRKHGSGLGGYSPRKRKSEAAVKTPSPTVRSPERKVATWDQLPSGINITSTGSIFTNFPLAATKVVEPASSIVATPATTKTHPLITNNSVSILMNASLESVQLTQATRPMRRLYIENLPPSASEKSVIDHLNEFLVSSGSYHIQTKPCISCIINKDKAQAIVEFLTPEDATAALSFDGNSLFGSVIKIRRPKDFIEASSGLPEKTGDVVRTVSDVVMDSPYKIFIGGISGILSAKMLMEIASSFGPLKAYHSDFSKELNGLCAFLEYEDHLITSKACAVLDGLMLGGCILTAVRASLDINAMQDNAIPPSYDVPPHAKPLLANVSSVIRLQNAVNPDDLPSLPENELEEILEDIRLECARFGTVKAVHLVRHSSSTSEPKFEASVLPDYLNASAGLESNAEVQIGSAEIFNEDIRESTSDHVVVIKEDEMQEASGPSEKFQKIDDSANLRTAESRNEEDDELQAAELAEDTHLLPVTADKEERKEGDGRKLAEEINELFVPGCVLVEFQRREAACSAAHCLHGRSYGELIVEVEYIPYGLYLERFPK